MANQITLNEAQLRQMVSECVAQTLLEEGFFGDMWNGIKGGANTLKNTAGQHYNSVKAGAYAGMEQGKRQQIKAQIKKSQEIINQEQQKINALRKQLKAFIDKGNAAVDKANDYASKNNSNMKYNYFSGAYDNRKKDFYNQKQYDKNGMNNYNNGYGQGETAGYNSGYAQGDSAGYSRGLNNAKKTFAANMANAKRKAAKQAAPQAKPSPTRPTKANVPE